MAKATIKNLQNTPYHIQKIPSSDIHHNIRKEYCYHYDSNNCRCKRSLSACSAPSSCELFLKKGTAAVSQYINDKIIEKKKKEENFTLIRNKKHYFKIGQTVYHKFFNKGIVKAIDYTQNKIIVIFDNKEINLHIPTITKNELLKPYNKF